MKSFVPTISFTKAETQISFYFDDSQHFYNNLPKPSLLESSTIVNRQSSTIQSQNNENTIFISTVDSCAILQTKSLPTSLISRPVHSDILYYFEATIVAFESGASVCIGFACCDFPEGTQLGGVAGSFGYTNLGQIKIIANSSVQITPCVPMQFTVGDIVGMGFDLIRKEIFITLNGEFVGTIVKQVPFDEYYATISCSRALQTIEFNFGASRFHYVCSSIISASTVNIARTSSNLFLESNQLIVHYPNAGSIGIAQCSAPIVRKPQPSHSPSVVYYEVTITSLSNDGSCSLCIGWCDQYYEGQQTIGTAVGTYGLQYDGQVCINGINGLTVVEDYCTPFQLNDVIGVGCDLIQKQLFFTKNGEYLGNAVTDVDIGDWFPVVSCQFSSESFSVNFGSSSPFLYDPIVTSKPLRHSSIGFSSFHSEAMSVDIQQQCQHEGELRLGYTRTTIPAIHNGQINTIHSDTLAYMECKLLTVPESSDCTIGLTLNNFPLSRVAGVEPFSISITMNGQCSVNIGGQQSQQYQYKTSLSFNEQDTIGLGFDILRQEIFITKNGEYGCIIARGIDCREYYIHISSIQGELFKVQTNFGHPSFLYHLPDTIQPKPINNMNGRRTTSCEVDGSIVTLGNINVIGVVCSCLSSSPFIAFPLSLPTIVGSLSIPDVLAFFWTTNPTLPYHLIDECLEQWKLLDEKLEGKIRLESTETIQTQQQYSSQQISPTTFRITTSAGNKFWKFLLRQGWNPHEILSSDSIDGSLICRFWDFVSMFMKFPPLRYFDSDYQPREFIKPEKETTGFQQTKQQQDETENQQHNQHQDMVKKNISN